MTLLKGELTGLIAVEYDEGYRCVRSCVTHPGYKPGLSFVKCHVHLMSRTLQYM